MSEEKTIQGPSPEEQQIRGIAGAIQRAEFAVDTLKAIPLTTGNFEQLQQTIDWLEGVRENLHKELKEARSHMPHVVAAGIKQE